MMNDKCYCHYEGRMMKRDENRNVEYKESWHDKYLEWICGYANAKGGTLYIGE